MRSHVSCLVDGLVVGNVVLRVFVICYAVCIFK